MAWGHYGDWLNSSPINCWEKQKKRQGGMVKAIPLMYHDVVNKGDFDSSGFPGMDAATYKLGVEEFEKHLGPSPEL